MPDATGQQLWQARNRLEELGFTVLTDGGNGTDNVTAQMPSPGATLHQGGQVMLYTGRSEAAEAETLVCVPDVKGLSIAEAASLLRLRELEMTIDGSGFAVEQAPAAGEFVSPGTNVNVTFVFPNP